MQWKSGVKKSSKICFFGNLGYNYIRKKVFIKSCVVHYLCFSLLVSLLLLVCFPLGLLLALCFFTSLICALLCILFYFLLCSLFCFGFTFCSALCFALCAAFCIVLPSFIAFGLSTCCCLFAFGLTCSKITLSLYSVLSSFKKLLLVGNFFCYF